MRQLVGHDMSETTCDAVVAEGSASPGWLPHIVIVAAARGAAETLEKAVSSIAFKSALALPCTWEQVRGEEAIQRRRGASAVEVS